MKNLPCLLAAVISLAAPAAWAGPLAAADRVAADAGALSEARRAELSVWPPGDRALRAASGLLLLDALVRDDVAGHCAAARRLLEAQPEDPDAWLEVGRCELSSDRPGEARDAVAQFFRAAHRLPPEHAADRSLIAYRMRAAASSLAVSQGGDLADVRQAAADWNAVAEYARTRKMKDLFAAARGQAAGLERAAEGKGTWRLDRMVALDLPDDVGSLLDELVEASAEPVPAPTPTPASPPEPDPTPQPSPAPPPEATPTPGPEATPTPGPEATPAPGPEATPSPAPEATPSPAPEATPGSVPSPDPAPSAESPPDSSDDAAATPPTELGDPPGFREVEWGASRAEVVRSEGRPVGDDRDKLFFEDRLAGIECGVAFRFDGDRLFEGAYVFDALPRSQSARSLHEYRTLRTLLVQKYGEPGAGEEQWRDPYLQQRGVDPARALENGDLAFDARWDFPQTAIRMRLDGRGGRLRLRLIYTDGARAPGAAPRAGGGDLDKL